MPIQIGTETPAHFQIGTERVGVMKIGTEIAYRLPDSGGPTAPWDFATSFSDGYAVDFIGSSPIGSAANANRLFEVVPPRGTLNRAHPSGMFVDPSIYAIERIHRFTDTMILIHNGGQGFPLSQSDFIPALSDDYTWYIIQMNAAGDALADPVYWKAWRANSGIAGIGGGFVRYDVAQSGYVHRGGSEAQFSPFLTGLQADRAMIALLPDAAWAVGG